MKHGWWWFIHPGLITHDSRSSYGWLPSLELPSFNRLVSEIHHRFQPRKGQQQSCIEWLSLGAFISQKGHQYLAFAEDCLTMRWWFLVPTLMRKWPRVGCWMVFWGLSTCWSSETLNRLMVFLINQGITSLLVAVMEGHDMKYWSC